MEALACQFVVEVHLDLLVTHFEHLAGNNDLVDERTPRIAYQFDQALGRDPADLLAERAGKKFAQSEHVKFLDDATVFKGTARYDGQPVIAEAFAAIGVNGVTPDATMSFAADNANSIQGILLDKNAATVKATKTVALKATLFPANVGGTITWASSDTTKATVSGGVVTGVAAGSAVITATCGDAVAVCNVTVTN